MSFSADQISIRRFRDDDAEFCFQIRANYFLTLFKKEIGEEAAVAGVSAFQLEDFRLIAKETEFFILEAGHKSAGFFIVRRIDSKTAELVLIYIDVAYISLGLGKFCVTYLERWIDNHWQEVEKIYVDTVIPKYNANFYRKLGYEKTAIVSCSFSEKTIEATRLEKNLKLKSQIV